MGLAVLPSRLKGEMEQLADYIVNGKDLRSNEALEKHADWVEEFSKNYDCIDASNVNEILQQEIGKVFCQVLECAGVYKNTEEGLAAFMRFVNTL
jgi:UDPglucose--hexose-1-phosphate uridylyltransferase